MVWNTIRNPKDKYKVLLSYVRKFGLQKKEREKETLRLRKRILKLELKNRQSSQSKIKSFYLFLKSEHFWRLPDKLFIKWSLKDAFKLQKLLADYLSSNVQILMR